MAMGPAMTTFEGFGQPWSHLERLVPDLRVEPAAFGLSYFAFGTVARIDRLGKEVPEGSEGRDEARA